VEQFFELERLGDEPFGAQPRHLDRLTHATEAGDDDGRNLRIASKGLIEHLPPIHPRQAKVRDEDVEGELVEPLQRLFACSGLFYAKTRTRPAVRQ
jgi:hypothetical protein